MMPRWCSEPRILLTLRVAFCLSGWMLLVQPARAHEDLLLQIGQLDIQLESHPLDADLLARRGDLYRQHRDYALAAADFIAARSAQADYPLLDLYEGLLELETGLPDAARQSFSRYLLNQPQHAHAWALRAQSWLALDRPEHAAQDYSQAVLHADQPSPGLYLDWALALVAAGESHWLEARKVVDMALRQFPSDVALLALGTDTALAQGSPVEATGYIDRVPIAAWRLPRWESRVELVRCLESETADGSAGECRQTAVRVLNEQVAPPKP